MVTKKQDMLKNLSVLNPSEDIFVLYDFYEGQRVLKLVQNNEPVLLIETSEDSSYREQEESLVSELKDLGYKAHLAHQSASR